MVRRTPRNTTQSPANFLLTRHLPSNLSLPAVPTSVSTRTRTDATHTRTCEQPPKTPPPRRRDGAQVVVYGGTQNREGNSHATISRRERDTARRANRAARRPDYDWLLFAARTRNSAQCNRTDHAVTSATCLHYHRGPCTDVNLRHPVTPTLRALRWRERKRWKFLDTS